MAGRFSVEAVFRTIDRVTAPVTRMQNRVGKFTRSAGRGFRKLNRQVDKFSRGLRSGALAVAGSLLIVGTALGSVIGTGADFEQAITNVGAVALKTRAEIAPLEQLALKLGRTTKFTATQSANAMEILSRAGFDVNQILTATPAILSAAAASGLEIAEVANHVSNVLKGMGLEMDQAANVADILALASSRTNSTIGSLGESMKNVASTARQLGIPLEEVVASVALLQDVGLDASVAGSAFNNMLTKMAAPSAKITKQMKKFGISFKDAKGDMLPLNKVMQQLSIASKKAGGSFDRVAFLAELVGLRGQKAASNLIDLFDAGKMTEFTEELNKATGSADRMAAIRMDTVQGSFLLLTSAIDAVKVKAFGLSQGPLKDVIDDMTKWVGLNEDLIASGIGGFISGVILNLGNIVTWTKRIGIGLAVFFTLATILKTLIGILTLVNLVIAANPITLMVLGVMALVTAFVALVTWIDTVAGAFDRMPGVLRAMLLPLELMVRAIKFVKDNIGKIGDLPETIVNFGGGGFGADFDPDAAGNAPQVVSPQDRTARSIEERRETGTADVTIRDETGRAEMKQSGRASGVSLKLADSGAF